MYDGYDVSDLVSVAPGAQGSGGAAGDGGVDVFIAAYGVEQPDTVGVPKVAAELHVTYTDGSTHVYPTHNQVSPLPAPSNPWSPVANEWAAFNADTIYLPNMTDNAGCSWFFYPHENTHAHFAPPGTPLSPCVASENRSCALPPPPMGPPPRGSTPPPPPPSPVQWTAPVAQPRFRYPLVPKPTAPMQVRLVIFSDVPCSKNIRM